MLKNLGVRFGLIAALVAMSGWLLYENYQATGSVVTLGLDLQGGTHLALEIEAGAEIVGERADAIERALAVIRTRIDELGVAEPTVQRVGTDRIVVELPGIRDEGRAREVIQRAAFLQFQIVQPVRQLERALGRMDRAAVDALGEEEVGRLAPGLPDPSPGDEELPDLFGTPDAPEQEEDDLAIETVEPDVPATERLQPLSTRILPSGADDHMLVAEEDFEIVDRLLRLDEVRDALPAGTVARWGQAPRGEMARAYRPLYLLAERAMMTGEMLEDAQATRDPELYQPLVTFQLTARGGREFERATARHVGDQMAIVLDERVISAPVIRSRIGRRGQIEMGRAGMEETRDLALILRAGALPAPLEVVEERSVGPSLGQDSIDRGGIAGIVGLTLVVLMILGYYRFAGVLAVIALGLYVILLMGGLALINATMTLPGIAGLILSIGMAVDANVLIFERIREEIDAGRSARVSVNEGFQHALSAIVDANLTTLITAFILFYLGTGPVRGFAVVLSIGIIASMFTAIFITRTFFTVYLNRLRAGDQVSI